jgi:MbtH protein
MDLSIDGEMFIVLVNASGQYSVWPADKVVPAGWVQDGPPKRKDECLSYIEQVWTDMRPKPTGR